MSRTKKRSHRAKFIRGYHFVIQNTHIPDWRFFIIGWCLKVIRDISKADKKRKSYPKVIQPARQADIRGHFSCVRETSVTDLGILIDVLQYIRGGVLRGRCNNGWPSDIIVGSLNFYHPSRISFGPPSDNTTRIIRVMLSEGGPKVIRLGHPRLWSVPDDIRLSKGCPGKMAW